MTNTYAQSSDEMMAVLEIANGLHRNKERVAEVGPRYGSILETIDARCPIHWGTHYQYSGWRGHGTNYGLSLFYKCTKCDHGRWIPYSQAEIKPQ